MREPLPSRSTARRSPWRRAGSSWSPAGTSTRSTPSRTGPPSCSSRRRGRWQPTRRILHPSLRSLRSRNPRRTGRRRPLASLSTVSDTLLLHLHRSSSALSPIPGPMFPSTFDFVPSFLSVFVSPLGLCSAVRSAPAPSISSVRPSLLTSLRAQSSYLYLSISMLASLA